MTGALSPTHWLLILVVVLLLFGAKRLPDAARGMGRSLRILKAETSALTDDDGARPAPGPETAPGAADETSARRPSVSGDAAGEGPARSTDSAA